MKFVDEAVIYVKAGDGGDGCVSFRREKYVPRGGPDGGNGGPGGDVIVIADPGMGTLLDNQYQKHYRGGRGGHGRGKQQTGARGEEKLIPVPLGTIIIDEGTGEEMGEIINPGDRIIVAAAGRGGRGNKSYATSTDRAPRKFGEGKPGEERSIRLSLKLIADVGLVGLPNVGKSTLISAVSSAHPKIADYPFTTLVPNLGVVRYGEYRSFVMADMPGLIQGAHLGKGLGDAFLKHIERTRLILHLVDISRPDPMADYKQIRRELEGYGMGLEDKPEIVVLSKIDIVPDEKEIKKLLAKFKRKKLKAFAISAVAHLGLGDLMTATGQALEVADELVRE